MKCKYCGSENVKKARKGFKSKRSPKYYKWWQCGQCGMRFSTRREDSPREGARLVGVRALEWKSSPPDYFPCFVPGCVESAAVNVQLQRGDLSVRLLVCGECARLSAVELMDRMCEKGGD